jgi:16S rRNA methyltransferase RsmB/F
MAKPTSKMAKPPHKIPFQTLDIPKKYVFPINRIQQFFGRSLQEFLQIYVKTCLHDQTLHQLDKQLAEFSKNKPIWGKRDRRIFSDVVFCMVRHSWYWLGMPAPNTSPGSDPYAYDWKHVWYAWQVFLETTNLANNSMVWEWLASQPFMHLQIQEATSSATQIVEKTIVTSNRWIRVTKQVPLEKVYRYFHIQETVALNYSIAHRVHPKLHPIDWDIPTQSLASQKLGDISVQGQKIWGYPWVHTIWDTCAGQGGKTLQILDTMYGKTTESSPKSMVDLYISDIRPHALRVACQRIQQAYPTQTVHMIPATKHGYTVPKNMYFDIVFVDAPCSSSGTYQTRPEVLYQNTDMVLPYQALQLQILSQVALHVAPGGQLYYCTCSLYHLENQAVLDIFLQNHPQFTLVHSHYVENTMFQGVLKHT